MADERRNSLVTLDRIKLTKNQATHLAKTARLPVQELVGKRLDQITDLLKPRLDPELLFFRRVCGQVVKTDPATGEQHGVPNATVEVKDTDCSFLGFFPGGWPWFWLFPFHCRTETLATVETDECGNFCVLVPRWDIDRILRFRRKRVCCDHLFKPNLGDLLDDLRIRPNIPRHHGLGPVGPRPQPDPAPFRITEPGAFSRIRERALDFDDARLTPLLDGGSFGTDTGLADRALAAPALSRALPPPVAPEIQRAFLEPQRDQSTKILAQLGIDPILVRGLEPSKWIGPFPCCRDRITAQWLPILDVPDITFCVTQDVDGDGTEETIYDEGFFDVRWNAQHIPDVTLEASGIALASPLCDGPDIDPDGCDQPTILTAGLMPLEPTHHDAASGYALRPNRHRPGGFDDSPKAAIGTAKTPYLDTLQLHGCHRFGGASHYRLLYQLDGASEVPFTNLSWYAPRLGSGPPVLVTSNGDGWYPVLDPNTLVFPHWLLNWNTRVFPNGHYRVRMEVGDGSGNVIDQSAPVAFLVDNRTPLASFVSVRWRRQGVGSWSTLPTLCPILERPAGLAIDFEVEYITSAVHFRNIEVVSSGCGGGSPSRAEPANRALYEHWYTDPTDNAYGRTATFRLAAGTPPGSYAFGLRAHGRGFNPAGSDGGPATDWDYDRSFRWAFPNFRFCVIDV